MCRHFCWINYSVLTVRSIVVLMTKNLMIILLHRSALQKKPIVSGDDMLTHWGRVTHICVGILTIIGSDNGLSSGRR